MNRFLLQTYPNTPSRIPGSIPPKDNEHLKVRIDLLYDGKELIRPHIDSYNFMLDKGLNLAVHDLSPVEVGESTCLSWIGVYGKGWSYSSYVDSGREDWISL